MVSGEKRAYTVAFGLVILVAVIITVVVVLAVRKKADDKEPEPCDCNGLGVYSSLFDEICSPDTGVCNCNISANVEGDHCQVCQAGFRNENGGEEPGSDGCPIALITPVVFESRSDVEAILSDIALDPRGQRIVAPNVSGLSVFALDTPVGVVSSDAVSFSVSYYEVSGYGLPDSVTSHGLLNMSAASNDSGSEFEMFGRTFEENVKVTADPVTRTGSTEVVYPYLYDARTKTLEATGLSTNTSNGTSGLQFYTTSLTQVIFLSVDRLKLSQWIENGILDTGFKLQINGWPELTDSLLRTYNGMTIFARWFFVTQSESLADASQDWSNNTLDRLLILLQLRCSNPPQRPEALPDEETVRILVHALHVSRSPQLLWMEREDGDQVLPGHAVLVYKHKYNEFTFYDPEFGREEQVLSYDSSTASFVPYYKGGFNRFYVYSHQAFQLTDTDMETVYNLTFSAFNDTIAPDIILTPFDDNITSSSLTVSGWVVPKPGYPMPAVLFSYLFSDNSDEPISRGRATVDASGYFSKDLVDVDRGFSKIVFIAGGYAPTIQRLRKRNIAILVFLSFISSLFHHHGYVQRLLYSLANPNILTVALTWDDGYSDIDLHILEPGGRHIYFLNHGGLNTPYLDYDNTVGFGPEHYFIEYGFQPYRGTLEGTYKIRVHYYRNRQSAVKRSIRWTIQVKGSTQESARLITGVLSVAKSWSATYEVEVGVVHFIAIADRIVSGQPLPVYHYSAQLWKNVLVLPNKQNEDKVSVLKRFNPQARKEGGVDLLRRPSQSGCNFRAWRLRTYGLTQKTECWENQGVAISYINYEEERGTKYIPVFVSTDWSKVQSKWNELILQARNYPYAEQTGSPVSRFPQSVYCIGFDVNNSNTFIRWLFKSVSIKYKEMRKSHPGRISPRAIPSSSFQGRVFCSSESPPALVTGSECPAGALKTTVFRCT
jgi:hypothetical protein